MAIQSNFVKGTSLKTDIYGILVVCSSHIIHAHWAHRTVTMWYLNTVLDISSIFVNVSFVCLNFWVFIFTQLSITTPIYQVICSINAKYPTFLPVLSSLFGMFTFIKNMVSLHTKFWPVYPNLPIFAFIKICLPLSLSYKYILF